MFFCRLDENLMEREWLLAPGTVQLTVVCGAVADVEQWYTNTRCTSASTRSGFSAPRCSTTVGRVPLTLLLIKVVNCVLCPVPC